MAEKACHVVAFATRIGLIPVLALMIKIIVLAAICICIANGCTTKRAVLKTTTSYTADGAVSAEVVDKPSTERYKILFGQSFSRELPKRENMNPSYPPELLAKQLDLVTVIARLIVDASGNVERAEIVNPTPEQTMFSDSVLTAVKNWTFFPLKRITGDKVEPLPFTQEYKFTFKQLNGRALVVQGSTVES